MAEDATILLGGARRVREGVDQPGAAREAMRGLLDLMSRESLSPDASTVALGAAYATRRMVHDLGLVVT